MDVLKTNFKSVFIFGLEILLKNFSKLFKTFLEKNKKNFKPPQNFLKKFEKENGEWAKTLFTRHFSGLFRQGTTYVRGLRGVAMQIGKDDPVNFRAGG